MIRGYFYRIVMKLSHKFNWHHMKPNPYLEKDKIHLWCHWCGARCTIPNMKNIDSIIKSKVEK